MYIKFTLILIYVFFCFSCNNDNNSINVKKNVINDTLLRNKVEKADSVLFNALVDNKLGKGVNLKELYGKMLKYDTTSIDNYLLYGSSLVTTGKKKEGLSYINRAILYNPNAAFGYFIKGMIIEMIYPNSRDSAYYYCNKAIKLDSQNVYYISILALLLNEDNSYIKSIEQCNKAITLRPNNRNLYLLRGTVKSNAGLYESALEDLKNIPNERKWDYESYLMRAKCHIKLKQYQVAILDCDTAILINPVFSKSYLFRATAKSNIDDYDGAYEDLKKGTELGDPECKELLQQMKEYNKTHKTL